ncbi:hypothetical protein HK096_003502, partial [Nowakowskiella sp. JEL0078]
MRGNPFPKRRLEVPSMIKKATLDSKITNVKLNKLDFKVLYLIKSTLLMLLLEEDMENFIRTWSFPKVNDPEKNKRILMKVMDAVDKIVRDEIKSDSDHDFLRDEPIVVEKEEEASPEHFLNQNLFRPLHSLDWEALLAFCIGCKHRQKSWQVFFAKFHWLEQIWTEYGHLIPNCVTQPCVQTETMSQELDKSVDGNFQPTTDSVPADLLVSSDELDKSEDVKFQLSTDYVFIDAPVSSEVPDKIEYAKLQSPGDSVLTDPLANFDCVDINVETSIYTKISHAPAADVIKTSDINTSEIKTPEIKNSDINTSEIMTSEIKNYDIETPEIKNPEIKNSGIDTSEIKTPEIKNYDIETPEIKNSYNETSEIKNEDIETSEIKTPKIKNSDINTSEIKTPEIKNSHKETFEIKTPKIKASGAKNIKRMDATHEKKIAEPFSFSAWNELLKLVREETKPLSSSPIRKSSGTINSPFSPRTPTNNRS